MNKQKGFQPRHFVQVWNPKLTKFAAEYTPQVMEIIMGFFWIPTILIKPNYFIGLK